jgi:hypothetical protein
MGRSVANPRGPIVSALRRASELAQRAGKERTSAWLRACAEVVEAEGYDAPWPVAPAYRGPVVHIEDPQSDLFSMGDVELEDLARAIANEQVRRKRLENGWAVLD